MGDRNQHNPNQRLKGWGFSFFAETPATQPTKENSADMASKLETGKSFPLAMASVGERLRIVKLKGAEGTVHRLIGMGFVPGIELQIISTTDGSVIVALSENRIGLGVGMAQKIMCMKEAWE
ncbi:MAG: ferrous iron transport protein A [Stigonema ocellatum SAG 48.90 = DSM 106950]|nr:ferrous iron transport protein A [Stigonema ocellatum SAG 48.90 = DSM 106950]